MGKAFDSSLVWEFIPKLLSYFHVTLLILALSVLFGIVIGFLVALPRLYNMPILGHIAAVYVSFMRGTPILIQLFLIFYGLPALLEAVNIDLFKTGPLVFVIVTYSLSSGASFSEIIRGSVNSIEKGQAEAAYSVGMTGKQAFVRIVLPQALVISFPNFGNSVIGFLKDTSLAFTIGVMDMMGRGDTLITATAHALEVYMSLSIIYYAVAVLLEKVFAFFENRLQRHEQRLIS
ncbi:amino acid ABC transporter permease [Neobacillus ginsengisoli]|uniref:L-cystine transport system permease protein n=1 Tax=Neobacillus ginsengisoli TaxID=904295 RepID=A0ABT9Y1K6_9BACI|nr:amino acid ABC transporter permease [Neobacillus ginsengisoli]MDQ0201523.1 L-cystine transport system permease protein [Neobacillus ginsengisoli]